MFINTEKSLLKLYKSFLKCRFQHNWAKPEGFDTGIKVYNCITKHKEPLILKSKDILTWYSCGPTVYSSSHIGHASYFIKLDIIQKILRNYFKLNVVTVMNITDIDDKIILKANESNTSFDLVAKKYETEFFTDLNDLGVSEPNIVLRVTENIKLIVDFIKHLVASGQAYKAKDNSVYFNVESYGNYGKLQSIGTGAMNQSKSTFKKSPMDFVLWKSSKEGEPFWESPWGAGRPGWHIECSALASHAFGSSIDIHAGGIDLKFPHHENEEAQSCSFHGTGQWVNCWIHTGHLHLKDSEKMSKSLKNTISIQEMLKSTPSEVFRMACIMSHYRSSMEYSKELLETAANLLKAYKYFLNSCADYKKGYLKATVNTDILNCLLSDCAVKMQKAFSDDFNTPRAIKILNKLVSVANSMLHTSNTSNSENGLCSVMAVSNFVSRSLSYFGVNLKNENVFDGSEDITKIMDILNSFRQNVRLIGIEEKNQNILQLCDTVRDELRKCGVTVKDFGNISAWSQG